MPIVFHKKYRNTGLNAFDQSFSIDKDGKLSPDPDDATAAKFLMLENYELGKEAPKKPEAAKAPKKAEAAEPAEKPSKAAPKKTTPRRKKASAKKAKEE